MEIPIAEFDTCQKFAQRRLMRRLLVGVFVSAIFISLGVVVTDEAISLVAIALGSIIALFLVVDSALSIKYRNVGSVFRFYDSSLGFTSAQGGKTILYDYDDLSLVGVEKLNGEVKAIHLSTAHGQLVELENLENMNMLAELVVSRIKSGGSE